VDKNHSYSFRGVYHGPKGGISRTKGGYITDQRGVYHGPGGKTKPCQIKALEPVKNPLNFLNLFKLDLKPPLLWKTRVEKFQFFWIKIDPFFESEFKKVYPRSFQGFFPTRVTECFLNLVHPKQITWNLELSLKTSFDHKISRFFNSYKRLSLLT